MNEFKDKVVILTGVSHGIGLAYLKAFMALESCVICIDKNPLPITTDHHVRFYQGDLKDLKQIHTFCQFIKDHCDHVDIIINNACINHFGLLEPCDYHQFNEVLHVGVSAPYEIVSQLKDHLANHSSIINMTSTRAFMSQANSESYTAAKGAIYSMTHAMSQSLKHRTRVNSISPGWIEVNDEKVSTQDHLQHPSGRIGNVSDIVNMALYLCSEKAAFITGQNFTVDGGMSSQMIYHNEESWTFNKD